jgi:hypothetical protein
VKGPWPSHGRSSVHPEPTPFRAAGQSDRISTTSRVWLKVLWGTVASSSIKSPRRASVSTATSTSSTSAPVLISSTATRSSSPSATNSEVGLSTLSACESSPDSRRLILKRRQWASYGSSSFSFPRIGQSASFNRLITTKLSVRCVETHVKLLSRPHHATLRALSCGHLPGGPSTGFYFSVLIVMWLPLH